MGIRGEDEGGITRFCCSRSSCSFSEWSPCLKKKISSYQHPHPTGQAATTLLPGLLFQPMPQRLGSGSSQMPWPQDPAPLEAPLPFQDPGGTQARTATLPTCLARSSCCISNAACCCASFSRSSSDSATGSPTRRGGGGPKFGGRGPTAIGKPRPRPGGGGGGGGGGCRGGRPMGGGGMGIPESCGEKIRPLTMKHLYNGRHLLGK